MDVSVEVGAVDLGHETRAQTLARASSLFEAGNRIEARQLAEGLLRADSGWYEPLDLEARILASGGEAKLAQRLLEEYTRYYPDHAEARSRLAWIHWNLGLREEAIAEARATLARHPGSTSARANLVDWMLDTGDNAGAAALAEAGLAQSPDDRALLSAMARAARRLRDEPRARRAYERLLANNPGDEDAARGFAEFLLDQNHSEEAVRFLEPFLQGEGSKPATLLRSADALFRSRRHPDALLIIQRLASDARGDSEEFQREVLDICLHNMGLVGSDQFAIEQLRSRRAVDSYALEMLERCGQRGNRGQVIEIYNVISVEPLRYPRAMARFLSTYSGQLLVPGAVSRWVAANRAAINSNAILWGGVGAWLMDKGKPAEVVAHLSAYEGRSGTKPWMLLILGIALESLGNGREACRHYRRALLMPPDHTELAVRSRLAFLLALEGMAATGHLIVLYCSESGKRVQTGDDTVRLLGVEALAVAAKLSSADEKRSLLDRALTEMQAIFRATPSPEARRVMQAFKARSIELLSTPVG